MKIVLSGSLAIDQIMTFDGSFADLIQKDQLEKISISVLVKTFIRSEGGIAGNIAYSLAQLGEKPILLASVGQEAKTYVEKLHRMGVETHFVHFSQLPTASFSVLTDRKENQIGGFYEGAMSDAKQLSLQQFAHEKTNILAVISAHNPQVMAKQVTECQKLGIKLFYDPGQQIANLKPQDLLNGIRAAQILILNEYEMALLSQKTKLSQKQITEQVELCLLTLGKKGAYLYEKGKSKQFIKAVKLKKAIDPTGAGDAFRAGFLYAYANNWPILTAVELACIIASFAVEKTGTQNHYLNWVEIKNRYEETYAKRLQN